MIVTSKIKEVYLATLTSILICTILHLLKRGDQVCTEITPNCKNDTLQKIIKGKTDVDSVIHSDGWRG